MCPHLTTTVNLGWKDGPCLEGTCSLRGAGGRQDSRAVSHDGPNSLSSMISEEGEVISEMDNKKRFPEK